MKTVTGFKFKIAEVPMGQRMVHNWRVYRFGREVAAGAEETLSKAQEAVKKALGELVFQTAPNNVNPKYKAQSQLWQMVQKRPYMVMAVGAILLLEREWEKAVERVTEEATREEYERWKEDANPGKPKIPDHGRSLTAEEAASRVLNLFKVGEYVRLDKHGLMDKTVLVRFLRNKFGGEPFGLPMSPEEEENAQLIREAFKVQKVKKPVKKSAKSKNKITTDDEFGDSYPEEA